MRPGSNGLPIFKIVFWIIAVISLIVIGILVFLALAYEPSPHISSRYQKVKPDQAPIQTASDSGSGPSNSEASPAAPRDPFQPPAGVGTDWQRATAANVAQPTVNPKIRTSQRRTPKVRKPQPVHQGVPKPSTQPLASPVPLPTPVRNGDAPPEEKETLILTGQNQSGLPYQAGYRVKPGDSISQIARKFGVASEVILKANGFKSIDAKLVAGVELVIPVPTDHLYRLKNNETIWRLAMRYGIPVAQLMEINQLTEDSKLESGRVIILPVAVTRIRNSNY